MEVELYKTDAVGGTADAGACSKQALGVQAPCTAQRDRAMARGLSKRG